MRHVKRFLADLTVLAEGMYKGARGLGQGYYRTAKEIQKGKTLIFLANGPSLNKIQFESLCSPQTEYACVNFFPLKDARFWKLRPSYLCLVDPAFWAREPQGAHRENIQRLVECLEKVDWPLKIITCNTGSLRLKNPQITYLRFTPHKLVSREQQLFRHWLYRHNLTNCGAQNVSVASLYFFVNEGYEQIYLAGVDMSEFAGLYVNENNDVFCRTQHAYGNNKVDMSETGLVKKGEFCDLLQLYCKMFAEFRVLAEYASSRKVSIINLNPYSYVDVFPKNVDFYTKEQKIKE